MSRRKPTGAALSKSEWTKQWNKEHGITPPASKAEITNKSIENRKHDENQNNDSFVIDGRRFNSLKEYFDYDSGEEAH